MVNVRVEFESQNGHTTSEPLGAPELVIDHGTVGPRQQR
jgi:hypothetical protein